MTTNFECKTREIIVYNGNDLHVDFYIKLFERYPNSEKYWEIADDADIIAKDGNYYDSVNDQYTCRIISGNLYCLYITYKYNIGHEWICNTVYLVKVEKDGNEKQTFSPKNNIDIFLTDKNCIELWKELRYPGVYTVAKYIDRLNFSQKDHSWRAEIDKDEIIKEMKRIIKGDIFISTNYSVKLMLDKNLSLDDIKEHKRNFMDKFLREMVV
jgi:hypothetical protein